MEHYVIMSTARVRPDVNRVKREKTARENALLGRMVQTVYIIVAAVKEVHIYA